jgi:transposase InsO family protein
MPWQEQSPMDLRMRFVTDWQSGCWTMTELCADYQISRKTGYKWVERYETSGPRGLHDQSRRPHHHPRATPGALVTALVALRRRRPHWGAKKLLVVAARRDPAAAWPSRSTVCDLLKTRGLVEARPRRSPARSGRPPLAPITGPNDTWTTDFKGEFRTGNGVYCYPLTLRDGFSRFVLRCDALVARSYEATRPRFEQAFAEYGLPVRIRSDNGGPFASAGLGHLSRLSVWWMRLGIGLERIAPGHPEQNGSHEQFHAVLKAETARPPAGHAAAQQRRFARFCVDYNTERPHAALHDAVPAHCYQPSPRPLPRHLPPLEYPGHCECRRVSAVGTVSWRNHPVFLSEALAGQDVAFEEVDDGLWTLRFATVPLARYDDRHRSIHPIASLSSGGRSASVAGSAPAGRTPTAPHP